MNILLLIVPILMLLMFSLGLDLRPADFARVVRGPRAALIGLTAQMFGLPLVAFLVAALLGLPPVLAVGLVLLAACPGGASSNAFTMLARGDVALSVSLTAVTSVMTVLTIPMVVNLAMGHWMTTDAGLRLPLGPVLGQNAVTILLPIGAGMLLRTRRAKLADRWGDLLRKAALPLLLVMIAIFMVQQRAVLLAGVTTVALATLLLIAATMALGAFLGWAGRLRETARRAILIEVGMQNAAQAMAVAASPFLLADGAYAIPAVVYAVTMNGVLLGYLAWLRHRAPKLGMLYGCRG
ncbi:bile acid:sodium symporter family protein [Desulfatitalea alkaliphila]|uniref:Bile acid:sodium symporter family protein n=1 Tax=Desulfatitalea alkaliphila TaxID=2929485 RepID=A0AA41R4L0_9BACT|nr:bile acid:sodium symporter family protein [Desulfatitalea alkaliphila]MCJ8499193.1 bile acid:sodium symporter family protein [Desulfatitalea alkaliphila]